MNYRDFLQKVIYVVINPIIKGMIRIGITPNLVTTLGFVGNLVAMWLFLEAALAFGEGNMPCAYAYIGWGGAIILFAGLFDMMDGRLARLGNMSSVFGALWDSTLDRYSELVTLFAIVMVFVKADWFWMSVVTFAALVGSIMVSYVRARAEGLQIECKVGLMQRPERVVLTALGAIATALTLDILWLAAAMAIIALLANATAFYRVWHCYKQLRDDR
jgi:CDP-diacylglycerol--glycerol-3-phosphate 3-phosphatidyltransferase